MLQKIVAIVKECGEIIKNAQIHNVELKNNDRRNLVTEYDIKIQSLLIEKLNNILPNSSFLGEEGKHKYNKKGYCFVCDPIDGTTNFVKGFNLSCISVALLEDGIPVLGVIYNPYADELFCAEKGKGSTLNGKKIYATKDYLADALVAFGTNVDDLSEIDSVFDYVKKCFKSAIDIRSIGSAALELCNIACGRTGYFFETKLYPWDYCAGVLIAEEAGAIVKSKDFNIIDDFFQNRPIFAFGNEEIFKEINSLK